jgi:hypothetical protein
MRIVGQCITTRRPQIDQYANIPQSTVRSDRAPTYIMWLSLAYRRNWDIAVSPLQGAGAWAVRSAEKHHGKATSSFLPWISARSNAHPARSGRVKFIIARNRPGPSTPNSSLPRRAGVDDFRIQ